MTERIALLEVRLTPAQRELVEHAALISGQLLTAFAVQALVAQATRVLAQEYERRLSERDWKRFLSILDDDEVAPTLQKAARKFRKTRSAAASR